MARRIRRWTRRWRGSCSTFRAGPWLVWNVRFTQERLGEMDTELFEHWFQSIAQAAGITLHVEQVYGSNNHHIIEGVYKGFARAMRQAVELDPRKGAAVPSTKGILGAGSIGQGSAS